MLVFGPIPSRRLGRSAGINNIPPKICSYSCIYCQVGLTQNMEIEPHDFYDTDRIKEEVAEKIESAEKEGESIDYLTFVPDGEPTLDLNLGNHIEQLKPFGIKIAVITNSSLLWNQKIRENLQKADWVSVKVDSMDRETWKKINRPHRSLEFDILADGILTFANQFDGTLVTETMLIKGLNDNDESIKKIADFLHQCNPQTSYISIPTRPPAEKKTEASTEESLIHAYKILSSRTHTVEYLIGYEGNTFAFTGNVENDLLSITAVHPMREEAIVEYLKKAKKDWTSVNDLIRKGQLIENEYQGITFYTRRLSQ